MQLSDHKLLHCLLAPSYRPETCLHFFQGASTGTNSKTAKSDFSSLATASAEARLLRQQRVRILRAPFAAKVHHEQVERAVLDGARRLLRNEILGDPRVGCAGLAQVAEDGDAGLVGPVVEDAADLVDECACLLQIS